MESVITWMGGKKALREVIAKLIPDDIGSYIEPFGGAGWVMLFKERWARMEVWNDLNSDLFNMFLQVKFHPEELGRELENMLHSRKLFDVMRKHSGITEIQRAARFIYIIRHSFGALGSSFGTGRTHPGGGTRASLASERIPDLAKRLDMVTIENLDYRDCLLKYDHDRAFFYVDPPYSEGHTYQNSKGFDHTDLRDRLMGLQGRWLLSYNDSEEIRELYRDCELIAVQRKQGIARTDKDYCELIIRPKVAG